MIVKLMVNMMRVVVQQSSVGRRQCCAKMMMMMMMMMMVHTILRCDRKCVVFLFSSALELLLLDLITFLVLLTKL